MGCQKYKLKRKTTLICIFVVNNRYFEAMKLLRIFKFVLIGLVLGNIPALAQVSRITTASLTGNLACVGAGIPVSFTTTNLVVANRSFTVQLSNAAGSFSTPLPLAIGKTSPIVVTIPTTATLTDGYKLRVVTDTTNVEYVPSASFGLIRAPTAILSGDATINVGESATLNVSFTGSGPWTYTFTNGTTGSTGVNPFSIIVSPTATTTYALQSASNFCGTGTVSGTAKITVVPRLSTAAFSPVRVCAGGALSVPFVLTGAFEAAGVVYTAQLSDATGSFAIPTNIGTGAASPISAIVPAVATAGLGYRVRVVANANASVLPSAAFAVRPLPTAVLSGNSTINVGESASLSVAFTGDAPWTYRLTDGTTGTATISPVGITVNPALSTTYILQSVNNECGVGAVSGSVRVTVLPRVSVADLTLGSVCAGVNINIPFAVTGAFEQPTTYTVQLSDALGSFNAPINLNTGNSSPISVSIPNNLLAGLGYRLRVVAGSAATSVSSAGFNVRVRPTASISGGSTINFGETANLTLSFTGESPWSFVLSDGTNGVADRSPFVVAVKPTQNTNYALNTVKNLCGDGSTTGSASVVVIPRLITEDVTANVCVGGTVEVRFGVGGVLPANTTYQAQLSDSLGNFANAILLGSGNKSPIVAAVPGSVLSGSSYRVRVLAENSAVANVLPSKPFQIRRKATATLSGGGNFEVKPGEEVVLIAQLTGDAPWNVVLSDNTPFVTSTSPLLILVKPNFPTTYTLQSVSNGCGAGTVLGSAVVNVLITSTEQEIDAQLLVFPNPTTDLLHLQINLPQPQAGEWQLVNANGQVLERQVWQKRLVYHTQASLKLLLAGAYVLRVRVGTQWFSRKIVKQ